MIVRRKKVTFLCLYETTEYCFLASMKIRISLSWLSVQNGTIFLLSVNVNYSNVFSTATHHFDTKIYPVSTLYNEKILGYA